MPMNQGEDSGGVELHFRAISGAHRIADHLELLAGELRAGQVNFEAEEGITLTTEGELVLDVEVRRRGLRNMITMSLAWHAAVPSQLGSLLAVTNPHPPNRPPARTVQPPTLRRKEVASREADSSPLLPCRISP